MGKPKIRFKGFTEEWEQRKLGEYVEITSGDSPAKFCEGDINYVKVDDLNYAYKTVLQTQHKVSQNNSVKMVLAGSVIFPKRGAAILTNKVRVLGVDSYMDTNMMALSSEMLDTDFLYILLSKEGLYKIADTSTIPQINNKHIEPYEICLPKLDEQKMIGQYFSNLDHLITLHQRKCDETKKLKKYMLQKMFPQNGMKFPEIRFEGFTSDWEQRKLGEIVERVSTTGTSGKKLASVEYEDIVSEQGLLNKNIYQKETIKTGVRFSGEDVLYGKLRPYLHNWLNPDFPGIAVGDWWVLKPINIDKNFLYRLIQSPHFDDMANQSSGTKMPRADWKLMSNTEFCVPSNIAEQAKIGAYFCNLDHLITLHQRKCDELMKIKKYMLQNMFV